MGVMPCGRRGCDNILCDRLSDEFGYICNECFRELVTSNLNIAEFMDTPHSEDLGTGETREKRLEEEFILY